MIGGVLQALGLGAVVGAVFAACRLSVPAPDNASGVAGVVGLFVGWIFVSHLLGRAQ